MFIEVPGWDGNIPVLWSSTGIVHRVASCCGDMVAPGVYPDFWKTGCGYFVGRSSRIVRLSDLQLDRFRICKKCFKGGL